MADRINQLLARDQNIAITLSNSKKRGEEKAHITKYEFTCFVIFLSEENAPELCFEKLHPTYYMNL